MSEKLYLYPLWVRVWHMLNAILCLLLILTGISLQYAAEETLIFRFNVAIDIHNISGIILSINFFFFIVANMITKNGEQYNLKSENFFKNILLQMRYYAFGIFKKANPPFPITVKNKFNPLQRVTYVMATYLCLGVIVLTGWIYFFPGIIPESIWGISGILINALLHVSFGFLVSFFLIIHVYFCTIGATIGCNFVSMITGWHQSH